MARKSDKYEAIKLRLQGKTYPFIKSHLGVSKGTLSYWLHSIRLSRKQLKKIKVSSSEKRVESFISTFREKRIRTFKREVEKEREIILPTTERDFLIAGLFLYLGEGGKSSWYETTVSNTNPSIIKFSIFWLTKILKVQKNKIKIRLHLYKDMDIKKEVNFWRKVTNISKKQFKTPYIKKTKFKKINNYTFGHGTCNIIVGGVDLKRKIIAAIKVVLEEAGGFTNSVINADSPHFVI